MGSRSKNSPRIRRKKPQTKDGAERAASKGQSRAIWTGTISFGLVNIPVALRSATNPDELDLDLLDRRDFSPVRYRRVNAKTGQEVPWNQIIKGYKHDRGQYIALSDADFQRANVEATRTIDIVDFVDKSEISPIYFDKPYYLAPLKNGQRAYALLRDAMKKAGKIGIAKIVIRTRQHLAALLTEADLLILNVLRFQHELRDPASIEAPAAQRGTSAEREIAIAEQLLNTMSGEWRPEKYHDEYRDDLLKLIQEKIDRGQTKSVEPAAKPGRTKSPGKVVDIMHLLRQSVDLKRKDNKDRQQKRKAG